MRSSVRIFFAVAQELRIHIFLNCSRITLLHRYSVIYSMTVSRNCVRGPGSRSSVTWSYESTMSAFFLRELPHPSKFFEIMKKTGCCKATGKHRIPQKNMFFVTVLLSRPWRRCSTSGHTNLATQDLEHDIHHCRFISRMSAG